MKFVKKIVVETADAEIAAAGIDLKYEVGTMIEIPESSPDCRRYRKGCGLLLLRYQRPDPDDLWLLP